jgi:hypothetical protein
VHDMCLESLKYTGNFIVCNERMYNAEKPRAKANDTDAKQTTDSSYDPFNEPLVTPIL